MLSAPRLRRRAVSVVESSAWPREMHPVVQRIYAARGVTDPQDAQARLGRLLQPDALGGLGAAVELLRDALQREQRILVVGDFDADGATGTAVAVRGLRLLGAHHVDFRVPHRLLHGYGLSPELVADLEWPRPDLLLTVDSGIACVAGVAAANEAGMRVIVTDHHLPGSSLPAAAAIVNPNLEGDAFPSKAMAGVGVVFYLLLALRRALRDSGWFEPATRPEPDLSQLLDLVALGTVADMVPLDANNRILVQAGLRRIRNGQLQPGLQALFAIAQRRTDRACAADFGFSIAPRIMQGCSAQLSP